MICCCCCVFVVVYERRSKTIKIDNSQSIIFFVLFLLLHSLYIPFSFSLLNFAFFLNRFFRSFVIQVGWLVGWCRFCWLSMEWSWAMWKMMMVVRNILAKKITQNIATATQITLCDQQKTKWREKKKKPCDNIINKIPPLPIFKVPQ